MNVEVIKGRRKNNCRRTDVEHVFNVLGTMESCPTYFCAGPKCLLLSSLHHSTFSVRHSSFLPVYGAMSSIISAVTVGESTRVP